MSVGKSSPGVPRLDWVDVGSLRGFREPYGSSVQEAVDEAKQKMTEKELTCFSEACRFLGVEVSEEVTSPSQLSEEALAKLGSVHGRWKMFLVTKGPYEHPDNKVVVTLDTVKTFTEMIVPLTCGPHDPVVYCCTSLQEFFSESGRWYRYHFYGKQGTHGAIADRRASLDLATARVTDLGPGATGTARTCFSAMCLALGHRVGATVTSPAQLPKDALVGLRRHGSCVVSVRLFDGPDDTRNHIQLDPLYYAGDDTVFESGTFGGDNSKGCFRIVRLGAVLDEDGELFEYNFYVNSSSGSGDDADDGDEGGERGGGHGGPAAQTAFGGMFTQSGGVVQVGNGGPRPTAPPHPSLNPGAQGPRPPASVVAESVGGGASNSSGGPVRAKKRNIRGRTGADFGVVQRNYVVSAGVEFNNMEEMFQDMVSKDYAQQIRETVFTRWGVPFAQPRALKYAEDLVSAFLVAVTASNKANYNVAFDIPTQPFKLAGGSGVTTSVEADFSVLSTVLESEYGVTRRQFARGLADEMVKYLRADENVHLLPALASRAGCELQMAHLAFDGSTHCKGMTSREVAFTKTLESRNLFEDDAVIAQGASGRLMQGVGGGPRSVQPR